MLLTQEQFKDALPSRFKKSVNQELIDGINQVVSDPDYYEAYRDNLVGYASVLEGGKYRIEQYLNAVAYVSYKLMGDTNIKAYGKTFPDKVARFYKNNVADKDVASYVTAYNKSKLVAAILEQSLVPSWVLNQDLYQKAINTQAELMLHANSEKVRSDAANSLLTHLKQPEAQKVELSVGVKEDGVIKDLRAATMELVEQQRRQIASGSASAQDVAHSSIIIEGECTDVDG